ncbi:branched-chain amino acid ABC transporter permease [Bradyrhizobium sp. NP1]|uniref:branched-chain amino acid ABC transporter permease n=1 Tax=Bradyrhizobium sp. NP1 TaxID=3049772 RepID=UPI0025A655DF|nr:branched-chain amino acid ABC transporter permease [Bradyrhizobium sp. NP1]WJR76841.1 branched-chain amino acid ABC transporter permease [Bradyrhizobium sp. NP1]
MIDAYLVTVLTLMTVWSIVALGLNVITGLSGQFNLGIGVYMGTGAYVSAILTTQSGLSFWEAMPLAVGAASLMGLLTGLPALRVREDSLAVLTIGLVFVFESLLVYLPYFGGPVGISKIPRVALAGQQLGNEQFLLLALCGLAVASAICWYVKNSWLGLALESIREDEHATSVIGIYPARFKLYAFAIGGGLAGLGGVFYAHFMRFISPYDFGFMPSVYVLVMLVFGGIGTIRGAIFGAVVLTAVPELFRAVQEYRNLVNGVILILMMLYQPSGLLGRGSYLWSLFQRMSGSATLVRPAGVSDAQYP